MNPKHIADKLPRSKHALARMMENLNVTRKYNRDREKKLSFRFSSGDPRDASLIVSK